jgi:hypothetical protein
MSTQRNLFLFVVSIKSDTPIGKVRRRLKERQELLVQIQQPRVVLKQCPVDFRQTLEDSLIGGNMLAKAYDARTTKTLMATAGGLFNTVAAMMAPCSVKAIGKARENFSLARWSQFVTTSNRSFVVSRKTKSSGKRSVLRRMA